MNKFTKNTHEIRDIVKDLPPDYNKEKQDIISVIRASIKNDDVKPLNSWIFIYFHDLAFKKGWKRKHIYLLVHELLDYEDIFKNFDDGLYDMESDLIGNCLIKNLKKYPGEPENEADFEDYVRGYHWL